MHCDKRKSSRRTSRKTVLILFFFRSKTLRVRRCGTRDDCEKRVSCNLNNQFRVVLNKPRASVTRIHASISERRGFYYRQQDPFKKFFVAIRSRKSFPTDLTPILKARVHNKWKFLLGKRIRYMLLRSIFPNSSRKKKTKGDKKRERERGTKTKVE